MARGYARGRERDEAARAALQPLAPGERPRAVTVAAVLAALLGIANLVLLAAGYEVQGEQQPAAGVLIFAALMAAAAIGMWQCRYWAVLGFEALLGIAILFSALSLLVASNLTAVALCLPDHRRREPAVLVPDPRDGPDPATDATAAGAGRLASSATMPESYDCIVIGSGPGGYVAAIRAAQLGMKTAVVEKDDVIGGRCLNYACIPAKAVLRVADIISEIDESSEFGITVPERTIDFAAVGERRRKVIKTLTGGVGGLMKKNNIDVIQGLGSVTSDANVRVGDTLYEAKTVILATGSVPKPVPGTSFGGRVIGTEEAWALEELPRTLAVIGAGASGAEIASAYGRMGTQVKLFEALDRVLPTEDADISKVAGRELSKQNIEIHTGTLVQDVGTTDGSVRFAYGDQHGEADWLVIAAGRGPDVEGLGIDEAGVELDDSGLIAVDGRQRTSRARTSTRSATSSTGRRSPTSPPTRASSPSRTPRAWRPTRSSTRTSRAPRSARRTSPPSG